VGRIIEIDTDITIFEKPKPTRYLEKPKSIDYREKKLTSRFFSIFSSVCSKLHRLEFNDSILNSHPLIQLTGRQTGSSGCLFCNLHHLQTSEVHYKLILVFSIIIINYIMNQPIQNTYYFCLFTPTLQQLVKQ